MSDPTLPAGSLPPPQQQELDHYRAKRRVESLLKATSILLYLLAASLPALAAWIALCSTTMVAIAAALIGASVAIGLAAHKPYVRAVARAREREEAMERRWRDWNTAWQIVPR
ncbi:hypothetical protein [Streptomyces sp. NPDC001135]